MEPMAQVVIMAALWSFRGSEMMPGISTDYVYLHRFRGFYVYEKVNTQCRNAVSDRALFAYKQVKPFDTMLTRALVEGVIMAIAYAGLLGAIYLVGYEVTIVDSFQIAKAAFLAWLLGFGLGTFFGTLVTVFPDMNNIVQ